MVSPGKIAERVVASILTRKLRPGERLGEQELADLFGVSRTMVREALMQLQALAGRSHELHSGIAVARDGKILFDHVAIAGLTMRPLRESEIAAYLDEAGDAVTSTVGAYQLEGFGVHLFDRIEGDHFTILGLPLLPLLGFLRGEGLLAI